MKIAPKSSKGGAEATSNHLSLNSELYCEPCAQTWRPDEFGLWLWIPFPGRTDMESFAFSFFIFLFALNHHDDYLHTFCGSDVVAWKPGRWG